MIEGNGYGGNQAVRLLKTARNREATIKLDNNHNLAPARAGEGAAEGNHYFKDQSTLSS